MFTFGFVMMAWALAWLFGASFWEVFKLGFIYIATITVILGGWVCFLYFFTLSPIIDMVVGT